VKKTLLLLDTTVLPSQLHAASGVKLLANLAIREFRRGVMVVRNLKAIQMNDDMIAANRHPKIAPFAWL